MDAAGNEQNLLSTLEELKIILKFLKDGRHPTLKTASMEDDLNSCI